MKSFILCCLLLAGTVFCEEKKSYRGHQVISVKAQNEKQVKLLQQLQDTNFDLIFLGDPSPIRETEIVVPPEHMVQIFKTLKTAGLPVTLVSADMQADIDAVMEENTLNKLRNNRTRPSLNNGWHGFYHDRYLTMDEIHGFLTDLPYYYPGLVEKKLLPYPSQENGELIYYLELNGWSDSRDEDDDDHHYNKPVIFIEGLAHAREWIVTASLLYFVDTMLYDYMMGDERARDALDQFTWIIIPVVNPDGYRYTWTHNRMWRKNRKFISSSCSGVDLNRNYDVDFGKVGASSNCRSDTYHGGSPFSEAETMNVYALFNSVHDRVKSFLSIHAYSQLLLYPWGYVNSNHDPNPPSNLDKLISVGAKMQTAIRENGGSIYKLGTAYGVLGYAASGAAEDWALHVKPNIFAYCYELRPASYSQGGFDIPANQIEPTGIELLKSLYMLAEEISADVSGSDEEPDD